MDIAHLDTIAVYGATALSGTVVAISASKMAFAVMLIPLTSGWTRNYVYFALVTTAVFAAPMAVMPWVQCRPLVKTFVDFWPGECIDKQPSVIYGEFASSPFPIPYPAPDSDLGLIPALAVWSALIDFSLALLPWKLLWALQMRTAEKVGVMVAMSLGLL